jgi:hypothetical protein
LKDLCFNAPGGQPFKWCAQLFGERILNLSLPPIDKEYIIGLLSGPTPSMILKDVQQLITLNSVDLAQLNDRPGFGANANVKIGYPAGLPEIRIDIGYFGLEGTVQSTDMVALELPTGLKFMPNDQATSINGAAVFSNSPDMPDKLANLVSAILSNDEGKLPSYVGTKGLKLGNIITFSKLVIDLNTSTVKKVASKFLPTNPSSLIDSVLGRLPENILTVAGADLVVQSASEVSTTLSTTIKNPFPVSLSIGSVDVNTLLDEDLLARISISPIKINSNGESKVDLVVKLQQLSNGDNGMDQTVEQLVKAVLQKGFKSQVKIGINDMSLTPTNPAARITQLSKISASVAAQPIIELLHNPQIGSKNLLDISKLLPPKDADILKLIAPKLTSVSAQTQPGAILNVGADVGYTNPLPLSASIPFFSVSTLLDKKTWLSARVSDLKLAQSGGNMQPRAGLVFERDSSLADSVLELYNQLLQDKFDIPIGIKGIVFGNAESQNRLLSRIELSNVNPFIAEYVLKIKAQIQQMVEKILADISNGQTQAPSNSTTPLLRLDGLNVEFTPEKTIRNEIKGALSLPFGTEINMGYLKFGGSLRETRLLDLAVQDIYLKGSGQREFGVTGDLLLEDSSATANLIAKLVEDILKNPDDVLGSIKNLDGSVGGGFLLFGSDSNPDNLIDHFSKIQLSVEFKKVVGILLGFIPKDLGGSIPELIKKLELSVKNLKAETLPGRAVRASMKAGFKSPFPINLKGLGYFSVLSGIVGELGKAPVVAIAADGLSITSGVNNMDLVSTVAFPKSSNGPDIVAKFVDNVYHNLGNQPENFFATGIKFGHSKDSAFNLFSLAKLGLKSSSIVNQENWNSVKKLLGTFDLNSLLNKAIVRKAHISAVPSGGIVLDAIAGLQNFTVDAEGSFGYVSVIPLLNRKRFG